MSEQAPRSTLDSFNSAGLQIPGFHQGDVQYKSCAIQQLAANNMDASSMMHTQDIARNDMPLGLCFDDATMQMLSEYFGINNMPVTNNHLEGCIEPTLSQDLLDNPRTGVKSDDDNQAPASFDQACRMPGPVLDNKDLNNTAYMNTMNDSSDENDTDDDDDILDADNIVRHF
ncbi:hypothetical protein QFC22_003748 [Naganishia vaughanmartiniae]|uniref:Uncharacterized protein n=1 Tax=Naganishia vaughanmartiniae TaxID=1424756 RepID=A0ACC2X6H4_9TREE|nr:hypothetical protein QFC22_003748 [Naganishia vaughanmartiniae]